eukprot:scaffold4708_cov128-Isochrysis_galbana.AAC.3
MPRVRRPARSRRASAAHVLLRPCSGGGAPERVAMCLGLPDQPLEKRGLGEPLHADEPNGVLAGPPEPGAEEDPGRQASRGGGGLQLHLAVEGAAISPPALLQGHSAGLHRRIL